MLWAVAIAAALIIGPRDRRIGTRSGTLVQAVNGHVGGLSMGRPVFVLSSHALARLWLDWGGSVASVEPWLRAWWIAIAATAAPATFVLVNSISGSRRAAILGAVAVAASPAFAHTSGTVLTDAPATAVMLWSLVLGARAIAAARASSFRLGALAGLVLGIAIGVREQTGIAGVSFILMLPAATADRRWRVAAGMIAGFGLALGTPIAYALATEPGYLDSIRIWFHLVGTSAAEGIEWRSVAFWPLWLVTLGPLTLVAAIAAWMRGRHTVAALGALGIAVTVPLLVQLFVLALYPALPFSPRYLLSAFPGALAIPAAIALDRWSGASLTRWRAAICGLALPVLIASPFVHARERWFRAPFEALPPVLATISANSVIVTGKPCPAIPWIQTQMNGDPARLHSRLSRSIGKSYVRDGCGRRRSSERLEQAAREGRPVVLDLRDDSWVNEPQRRALVEVTAFANAPPRGAQLAIVPDAEIDLRGRSLRSVFR